MIRHVVFICLIRDKVVCIAGKFRLKKGLRLYQVNNGSVEVEHILRLHRTTTVGCPTSIVLIVILYDCTTVLLPLPSAMTSDSRCWISRTANGIVL